jgi:hypothetical protein
VISGKVSDTHNFGRSVQEVQIGNFSFFEKPRPIHSEMFLLGVGSPLKIALVTGLNNDALARSLEAIFSLDGEIVKKDDDWCRACGRIKKIEKIAIEELLYIAKNSSYIDDRLYDFGALIAYCLVFGVRDLNFQNFVFTDRGYHLVDAEVAFELINFASQTNAFGTNQMSKMLSGLAGFFVANGKINQHTFDLSTFEFTLDKNCSFALLTGFLEMIDLFEQKRIDVLKATTDFFYQHMDVPLRIIFRNTLEYSNFLFGDQTTKMDFLKSELEQLSREEVPYFFYYPNRDEIYYLKDANGVVGQVSIPAGHPLETMVQVVKRGRPETLLSIERISELRANGSIEIFREFFKGDQFRNHGLRTNIFELNNKILYEFGKNIFSGPRHNQDLKDSFELNFQISRII